MTSSTFRNIIKINTNTTTNTFRLTFEVNFVISQTTHSTITTNFIFSQPCNSLHRHPHIYETCLVLMLNPPVLLFFWRALASVCGLNRNSPIINHPRPPWLLLLQLQVKYDEEQSGPSLPPSLPTMDKFLRQKKRRVPKFPFRTLLWRLRRVVTM